METMGCTVFDPRPKRNVKTKALSKVNGLLASFGSGLSKNVVQIANGAAQGFASPQSNENESSYSFKETPRKQKQPHRNKC